MVDVFVRCPLNLVPHEIDREEVVLVLDVRPVGSEPLQQFILQCENLALIVSDPPTFGGLGHSRFALLSGKVLSFIEEVPELLKLPVVENARLSYVGVFKEMFVVVVALSKQLN